MVDWRSLKFGLQFEMEMYVKEMKKRWLALSEEPLEVETAVESTANSECVGRIRLKADNFLTLASLRKRINFKTYLDLHGRNGILYSAQIHLSQNKPKGYELEAILPKDVGSLLACHAFVLLSRIDEHIFQPNFCAYFCYILDGVGNITMSIIYLPPGVDGFRYSFRVDFPVNLKRPFISRFAVIRSSSTIAEEVEKGVISDNINLPSDLSDAFKKFQSFLLLVPL